MIFSSLNKVFAKGTCIKLTIIALILQVVSLFRNYPLNPPCGRVLEITKGIGVLINCDSAVYMKDAQSPSRLFNGESVYQDRPLPTLLVSLFAKIWHFFNLPDYYRDIVGNSGVAVTYSLVTYILFLILSASILSISCWLGIRTFSNIANKFQLNNQSFISFSLIFTVLISMNELTKTFFWTPGSQMFNLLIPVYLFYLLQFAYSPVTTKFFMLNICVFILLMFSYAFFILLIIPLVLLGWKNYRIRILVITISLLVYTSYPIILRLCGGTYNNFALGYRRMYIWVIDSYFNHELIYKIRENLIWFLKTFPITPIVLSVIVMILFAKYMSNISKVKLEFITLFFYLLILAFYGYNSRRLTYPLLIFLFLIIIKLFMHVSKKITCNRFSPVLRVIFFVVLYSWLFSNGPLV